MASPVSSPIAPTPGPLRRGRHLPVRAQLTLMVLAGVLAFASVGCVPTGSSGSGFTSDVTAALNQDRASAGLPPLSWNSQLGGEAQDWAGHLASIGALAHSNLPAEIGQPSMAGWTTLGENVLYSPGDISGAAAEVLWMASAGHRANILSPAFNSLGVGVVHDSSGHLWAVVEFGAR